MPLIVSATLSSSIYFPGDTIYCKISFSNVTPEKASVLLQYESSSSSSSPRHVFVADITPFQSDDKGIFNIMWSSAQIHGNYSVDPTWLKLPPLTLVSQTQKSSTGVSNSSNSNIASSQNASNDNFITSNNTDNSNNNPLNRSGSALPQAYMGTSLPNTSDLGVHGRSIFSSPTTILGCELKVLTQRTFFYYATLPSLLPPSFKGSGIKYSYYVTVAVQVNQNSLISNTGGGSNLGKYGAHIFNIPIRVLTPAAAIKKLIYPLGYPGVDYDAGCLELSAGWDGSNYPITSDFPATNDENDETNGNPEDAETPEGTEGVDDANRFTRQKANMILSGSRGSISQFSVPLELELSSRPEMWSILVARHRMHKQRTQFHSNSFHPNSFPLVPYPQTTSQYDSYHTKHALNTLLEKHSKQVTRHISKGENRLLTFSIAKSGYQLGETVSGSITFQHGSIPCYQVSVRLECEETVDQSLLVARNGARSTRRVFGELHEYTLYSLQTHFTFYIPIEAPPEFSTDQIAVQWFLHFEFVTSATPTTPPPPNNMSPSTQPTSPKNRAASPNGLSPIKFPEQHAPPNVSPSPSPRLNQTTNPLSTTETPIPNGLHNVAPNTTPPPPTSSASTSSTNLLSHFSTTPTPISSLMKRYSSTGQTPPLVDTLNWSMPIRVFVLAYPHDALYNTRNLLRP